MSQYTPTSGTILQINHNHINASQYGCELTLTLQSMDQGIVNIAVSGSTYVFNHHPLKVGDSVTCFYSLLAPVPLIYPPLYRALVVVPTPSGTYASLDVYHRLSHSSQLANSDDTLILNLSRQIPVQLPNGQPFLGALTDKLLLVLYSATTRSIPAQTTPDQIIVFCPGE